MTAAAPAAPVATAERWEGRDVSVEEVFAQLGRMRDPDGAGGAPARTLASTLTLLAFAPGPEEATAMEAVLRRMGDHMPSRAVLLSRRPGPRRALDATLETRGTPVEAGCAWMELVTLTLSGVPPEALASAAVPLLRHDLPTFLWWPDAPDPAGQPALPPLAGLADRLVAEGGHAGDPAVALARLQAWCGEAGPALSDLGWAAVTAWRQLVTQLVGGDALAGLRAGGTRLELQHAGPRPGLPALLMAGWLREVIGADLAVSFSQRAEPGREVGLMSLRLDGPGGRALELNRLPERDSAEVIVTERDGRTRRRVLSLPSSGRAELLAGELELPRRDRPFERALPHALALARQVAQ